MVSFKDKIEENSWSKSGYSQSVIIKKGKFLIFQQNIGLKLNGNTSFYLSNFRCSRKSKTVLQGSASGLTKFVPLVTTQGVCG